MPVNDLHRQGGLLFHVLKSRLRCKPFSIAPRQPNLLNPKIGSFRDKNLSSLKKGEKGAQPNGTSTYGPHSR
jgi:hypothetical protein